jgi:glycosyltransferase involved in cell wall biosynthesis
VVTTPVGGMQELVIHEKTGLRAEPSNPESVANMIVRLLKDVNLRQSLARAGREMVLARYTWEKVAEQTLAAYRQITQ